MIAIIKYNAGNIMSVTNALKRLGFEGLVTDNHQEILNAEKVIFPGVGEASSAMKYLRDNGLDSVILALKQPVLGICLGQQLMCRYSDEGNTKCLGIFDTVVKRFPETDKVPHMGWNNFFSFKGTLFEDIKANDNFYYVHSYYAEICQSTTAVCEYIVPFSASMNKGNFYATQFHPEKSASAGETVLKNFLRL